MLRNLILFYLGWKAMFKIPYTDYDKAIARVTEPPPYWLNVLANAVNPADSEITRFIRMEIWDGIYTNPFKK